MRGIKFTLVANSFNGIQKPFSVTLPEDDPRVSEYNNGSFKRELVQMAEPEKKSSSKTKTDNEGSSQEDPTLTGFDLLASKFKANVVEGMKTAGFITVELVAESTKEDLLMIDGIGETTALKIIDVANEILEAENQE